MKRLLNFFNKKKEEKPLKREELERKAIEGAEKAVREYRGFFERFGEYDRTTSDNSELLVWTDKFMKRYRVTLEALAKR